MKTKTISFYILASLIITLSSCRKDISVPEPELEKVFGTWEWTESIGQEGITTPETEEHSVTIEFNRDGRYKKYKDGKKIHKRDFEFKKGNSIFSSGSETYLIDYTSGKINKQHFVSTSFYFIDENTLVLSLECLNCHSHTYIRK